MKVKILKIADQSCCYECSSTPVLYPATEDWEEVTEEGYEELVKLVQKLNSYTYRRDMKIETSDFYTLVSYEEDSIKMTYKNVSDFKKVMATAQKDRERKEELAKKKKAEAAKERKLKQLEKLKKEFGEV